MDWWLGRTSCGSPATVQFFAYYIPFTVRILALLRYRAAFFLPVTPRPAIDFLPLQCRCPLPTLYRTGTPTPLNVADPA